MRKNTSDWLLFAVNGFFALLPALSDEPPDWLSMLSAFLCGALLIIAIEKGTE
jgi:hypothetical protein